MYLVRSPRVRRWTHHAAWVAAGLALLALAAPVYAGEAVAEAPVAKPAAEQTGEAIIAVPGFEPAATFKAPELYKHLAFLAGEKTAGRGSGTEGCRLARDFIVEHFKKFSLQPGGVGHKGDRTFHHPFDFVGGVSLGKGNRLEVKVAPRDGQAATAEESFEGQLGEDFTPLRLSAELAAGQGKKAWRELVFAGYGISDEKAGYDDYDGLDVKGKVVIALRGEPVNAEGKKIDGTKYDPHEANVFSDIFYKASTAREAGAAALIMVSGYRHTDEKERAMLMSFAQGSRISARLPVVHVATSQVEAWLAHTGMGLQARQEKIDAALKPASEELAAARVVLGVDVEREKGVTENVIGILPGTDEKLKDEILVIGAHYDHLGMGNEFSLADKGELGKKIHYGADDNASGTASLIEIARAFAARRDKLKRTVWFIAFSGEELGTLGSLYFVKHPPADFDLKKVVAMVNLDMVGRCQEEKVMVSGVGTADEFDKLLEEVNADLKLKVAPREDGFGGSDQTAFLNNDIPVLFFFTGTHADYHKPSDTLDKLNLDDQARITALAFATSARLANAAARPAFVRVEAPKMQVAGMGGVRMGTLPDYSYQGEGLRISGTRGESPADKAGMKKGDIIIEFNGKKVLNIYDYMNALRQCSPGDEIEVVVLRGEEKVKLKATPEKR